MIHEFPFSEHADGESEVSSVGGGDPLLSGFGRDESIVLQVKGEVVSADEETVVKTSLIDEGFVLDTTLLGVTCESQAETGQQKNETTFFHERRKCW